MKQGSTSPQILQPTLSITKGGLAVSTSIKHTFDILRRKKLLEDVIGLLETGKIDFKTSLLIVHILVLGRLFSRSRSNSASEDATGTMSVGLTTRRGSIDPPDVTSITQKVKQEMKKPAVSSNEFSIFT